jgi:phosphate transport system protein
MTLSASQQQTAARRALEAELSRMAALVEKQLRGAITAFQRRDVAGAEAVIKADERIDEIDLDIETRAISMLADAAFPESVLREMMTLVKMAGEMERVGDLAKNVAKRTLVVSREEPASPSLGVARMGQAALRQFSDILNAYAARNIDAALAVWRSDDDLDELYNSVFQEITLAMMEDSGAVNACTHLSFIAKNFERVGDHATNIAEALHFLVTGARLPDARPKGDETSTTVIPPPKPPNKATQ